MKQKIYSFLTKFTIFTVSSMTLLASMGSAASAASLTAVEDHMSRVQTGATGVTHDIRFISTSAIATGQASAIVITWPSDFDFGTVSATSSDFTISSGTVINSRCTTVSTWTAYTVAAAAAAGNVWGFTGSGTLKRIWTFASPSAALGISAGDCVRITYSGATGSSVNPSVASSSTVQYNTTIATQSDSMRFTPVIVSDDQTGTSVTVNPYMTFEQGDIASGTTCDATYLNSGQESGTVALGTLVPGTVTSSDASSVDAICTVVITNADLGATVQVKSTNGALSSTVPVTATMPGTPQTGTSSLFTTAVAGAEYYGLCVKGGAYGAGSNVAGASVTLTPADDGYDASDTSNAGTGTNCTTAAHAMGKLTTSFNSVWSINQESNGAYARLLVKAAVDETTRVGTYTDTLTFVAFGTF